MQDIIESSLLLKLNGSARSVSGKLNSAVTAERLVVAAIETVADPPARLTSDERWELRRVGETIRKACADPGRTCTLLRRPDQAGKGTTYDAILYYQKKLAQAREMTRQAAGTVLTADLLLGCIFLDPCETIRQSLSPLSAAYGEGARPVRGGTPRMQEPEEDGRAGLPTAPKKAQGNGSGDTLPPEELAEAERKPEEPAAGRRSPLPGSDTREEIGRLVEVVKQTRAALLEKIFGQDNAVSVFANGFFQGELNAIVSDDRSGPRATFLFAGPPGVGKTMLAETAGAVLGLPTKRFDMSEYADKEAPIVLCGAAAVYRDSSPGVLTDFVRKNPYCLLIFDEIEKAHPNAIHLFLQLLDSGRLRDANSRREISFTDTVCIFTTNAGKQLYEDSESGDLSSLSRKVILKALEGDINPLTKEPFFPAAICSRFASGNVVMFNRMTAHDLQGIAGEVIRKQLYSLKEKSKITAEVDERVCAALLMAEGGSPDARMVQGRARSFVGEQLFELLRLIDSDKTKTGLGELKQVRFTVQLPEGPGIRDLFETPSDMEALVFAPKAAAEWCGRNQSVCRLAAAGTLTRGKAMLEKSDPEFLLLDMNVGKRSAPDAFLNAEDVESESRDFFRYVREKRPELPVYVIAESDEEYGVEEELSFRRMGVRGFIQIGRDEGTFEAELREICDRLHRQRSIAELARANRVLAFETGQRISEDGTTAEICLFDFAFSTAVDAEDADNVMSGLSRPGVRFRDVIGAEDAKQELRGYVDYLRDPKKYAAVGVSAPKGILLYGPPGTGKTMLAKALACESGAAFLAAEGNQFLKKYLGEGPDSVRELFRTARKYAPAILFVDEIDAIAKRRTGSEQSEGREEILTAFLTQMDGFRADPTRPVFVLAATNFDVEPGKPTSLDGALLRRFDRRICVDLPNREERIRYLKQEMAKNTIYAVGGDMLENLAIRATGMSLADLASVLELSLRTAVRDGRDKVTDAMLEEAFETFNSGEAKKWEPAELERTARHEAGHALMSWLNGDTPSYLTVVARADHGGYMQYGDEESRSLYTKKELLARIRSALGGRAAEIVCYGPEEGVSTVAAGDLADATAIARRIICAFGMDAGFGLAAADPQEAAGPEVRQAVNRILSEQLQKAVEEIAANRAKLDALTDRLLAANRMTGPEIDAVLTGAG